MCYEDTTGLGGPKLSPELHPALIQGFWGQEGGLGSPVAPHRLSLRSLLPRCGTRDADPSPAGGPAPRDLQPHVSAGPYGKALLGGWWQRGVYVL